MWKNGLFFNESGFFEIPEVRTNFSPSDRWKNSSRKIWYSVSTDQCRKFLNVWKSKNMIFYKWSTFIKCWMFAVGSSFQIKLSTLRDICYLKVRYFQKTRQIIFLPFWQTCFFFLILETSDWLTQLSQLIRSLQNSKKFAKKAKIWFDEFFENTTRLVIVKIFTWELDVQHYFE